MSGTLLTGVRPPNSAVDVSSAVGEVGVRAGGDVGGGGGGGRLSLSGDVAPVGGTCGEKEGIAGSSSSSVNS